MHKATNSPITGDVHDARVRVVALAWQSGLRR